MENCIEFAKSRELVRKQTTIGFARIGLQFAVEMSEPCNTGFNHAATELNCRKTHFRSVSDESVNAPALTSPLLPFATQPSCYSASPSSSSSNSENEAVTSPNDADDDEEHSKIIAGMRSANLTEVDAAVTSLWRLTRVKYSSRAHLGSARPLSALKPLVVSRHVAIWKNSLAVLVNLSLEKSNKIKIVRSGILLPIMDVLKKVGSAEAKEHACGMVFSLALDDDRRSRRAPASTRPDELIR